MIFIKKGTWRKKLISFGILLMIMLFFFVFSDKEKPGSYICVFDTGTSDASLIHTNDGENIVIDCADIKDKRAQIENSLIPFCLKKGIRRIDYLIITHSHTDHSGGLQALGRQVSIVNLILNREAANDSLVKRSLSKIKTGRIIVMADTMRIALKGSELLFLHPDSKYITDNPNSGSIITKWSQNGYKFLFCADADLETERYLLKRYRALLDADMIKTAHHGSQFGSSEEFLETVGAQYAVITASKSNKFNFPHEAALKRMQDAGIRYFITGFSGAVRVDFVEDKAFISSFRNKEERFLIEKR